ncbi:hypothetical protein BC835DRAFT_1337935 [Cytidiella melzeri]|nr:hypothetical protein BC835DRAFT_1337935 [Cytidiella melzeri]
MPSPAYLLVFSEPGPGGLEEEFNNLYDNEHIPKLVNVPAFLSWTRWKAVDGNKPTWAASYDLTSYEETVKAYTTLAETRSDREKKVLRDLEVMERRTYEAYEGNDKLPKPSALYDPSQPGPFAQIASLDVTPEGEEEFNRWYDEVHIPTIATVPGWVRSRRFVLKDWTRGGVEGGENKTPVAKWLAVHEYTHLDGLNSPEEQAKFNDEWTKKIFGEIVTRLELRLFAFHKKWERK